MKLTQEEVELLKKLYNDEELVLGAILGFII